MILSSSFSQEISDTSLQGWLSSQGFAKSRQRLWGYHPSIQHIDSHSLPREFGPSTPWINKMVLTPLTSMMSFPPENRTEVTKTHRMMKVLVVNWFLLQIIVFPCLFVPYKRPPSSWIRSWSASISAWNYVVFLACFLIPKRSIMRAMTLPYWISI